MTPAGWKVVSASVRGTSHAASGAPCQDSHAILRVHTSGGDHLIVVCADGAGSAKHAEIGATTACAAVATAVAIFLRSGSSLSNADDDQVKAWCREGRKAVRRAAAECGATVRDLACTLVAAVVGAEGAVFFQIGDGAVVGVIGQCCGVVFWPQGGEYAGTTYFLTDDEWEKNLLIRSVACAVDELALFTDGLERLILRFAEQVAHVPFLAPMWAVLRRSGDGSELSPSLESFLESAAVVERTDDDKTLILATRRSAEAAASDDGTR